MSSEVLVSLASLENFFCKNINSYLLLINWGIVLKFTIFSTILDDIKVAHATMENIQYQLELKENMIEYEPSISLSESNSCTVYYLRYK